MLSHLALDGFWLLGGLVGAALLGFASAQYIKDKINGVPSPLRTALKATETAAVAKMKAASTDAVTEVTALLGKLAPVKATTAAPAAPAAPAVAAAQPVQAAAPAPAAKA